MDAVSWVRSIFSAHRADRPAVHNRPALVEPSPSAQFGEEGLMQAMQPPARSHSTKRRQHVLPEPYPNSRGNICHGNPPRSTNRMPVSAARSETRSRMPQRRARRRASEATARDAPPSAASKRGCAMRDRAKPTAQVQQISRKKYPDSAGGGAEGERIVSGRRVI